MTMSNKRVRQLAEAETDEEKGDRVFQVASAFSTVESMIRHDISTLHGRLDYLSMDLEKGKDTGLCDLTPAMELSGLIRERSTLMGELEHLGIDLTEGDGESGG